MTNPKVLVSHPGTQHAPRLALELAKMGWLKFYITSLASTSGSWISRLAKINPYIKKLIYKRKLIGISSSKLVLFPVPELIYLIKSAAFKNLDKQQNVFLRNQSFQKALRNSYINESDLVIGFDTSSWILAEQAVAMKKHFILDQTTTHPKEKLAIFENIKTLYPKWKTVTIQKSEKLIELEEREYKLSSCIVVASTFAKETLSKHGVPIHKIKVNPYGVDLERFYYTERVIQTEKLIYLFIGSVSAGKGIPFLIDAWEKSMLGNSELWIVGNISNEIKDVISESRNVKIFGKVAHRDLQSILKQANVFVFPSYFDGFGLVILEAMASGLPVITTTATGGPDVITDGKEGFIITPGDEVKMIQHMEFFYKNPSACHSFGKLAREKVKNFTWEAYRDRWKIIINEVLETKCS